MKFFVIGILIIIALSSSVVSLNCQYKEVNITQELGTWIYYENGSYLGAPLEVKDFVSPYKDLTGCSQAPSATIHNQYPFAFHINVSYLAFHPAVNSFYGESQQQLATDLVIPAYSDAKIYGECLDIGPNEIQKDSITYTIYDPAGLILQKGYRQVPSEVCKLCVNNTTICLNDGAACDPITDDAKCGSGICNIAGFCGSQKIVNCPSNLMNCNNQSCRVPSAIDNGAKYSCQRECKSGAGREGICTENFATKVKKLFLLIISVTAAYLILRYIYREKIIKEQEKKHIELIKKLESQVDIAQKELDRINKKLAESKLTDEQIEILQNKKEEQNKLIEEINRNAEKTTKPFFDEQAGRPVIINPYWGYYKCYYHKSVPLENYKKDWLVHIAIWKKHFGDVKSGCVIHHKDFKKYNNAIENLEELSKEEHDKLHGYKVLF